MWKQISKFELEESRGYTSLIIMFKADGCMTMMDWGTLGLLMLMFEQGQQT
jgi:hypothetical protein